MPPSEATLVRLHGDYAVAVFRFAWSVTKDELLAQDVVQELFLKLARDAAPLESAESERAMIFTMTRHLALDALRQRSLRDHALNRLAEEVPTWFEASADVDANETQRLLVSALAGLPEEQRSVVHLHLWEELTFREIGQLLDAPIQTIASRYRYGLEKLRAVLPELNPALK